MQLRVSLLTARTDVSRLILMAQLGWQASLKRILGTWVAWAVGGVRTLIGLAMVTCPFLEGRA